MEQGKKSDKIPVEVGEASETQRGSGTPAAAEGSRAQEKVDGSGGRASKEASSSGREARKEAKGDKESTNRKKEEKANKAKDGSAESRGSVGKESDIEHKASVETPVQPIRTSREEILAFLRDSPSHRLTTKQIDYLMTTYNLKRGSIHAVASRIRKKYGWGTKRVKRKEEDVVEEKVPENASKYIAEDINKSTPEVKAEKKVEKKDSDSIWNKWWLWLIIAGAAAVSIWLFWKNLRSKGVVGNYQNVLQENPQTAQSEVIEQPVQKEESDYERIILRNLNN